MMAAAIPGGYGASMMLRLSVFVEVPMHAGGCHRRRRPVGVPSRIWRPLFALLFAPAPPTAILSHPQHAQNGSFAGLSQHAGGGTRTPDTRIMIPLL
jgi:hypothetical protein